MGKNKKRKKQKKVNTNNIAIIGLLIVIALLITMRSCEYFEDTEDTDTEDTTTTTEQTTHPVDEEEECWWQTIDEIDATIPAETRIEYKNDLPSGEFMWQWALAHRMNIEITREMTGVDNYPNSLKDDHEFTSTGEEWGIALTNDGTMSYDGHIELLQWLCEGDPLNFNPHMFDEPYSETYYGQGQYPN